MAFQQTKLIVANEMKVVGKMILDDFAQTL